MAKIKHTKDELKTQREALARFERFLPMLQLKQQQLQMEMQTREHRIREIEKQTQDLLAEMEAWMPVFSDNYPIEKHVAAGRVEMSEGNIAGVSIPVLRRLVFQRDEPDLFDTPPWIDPGLDAVEKLATLRVEMETLAEQRRLLGEELRVTTQRVNLFDKVKIPECRENIRVIRIFLGDEQTAAVARAKIAKARTLVYEYEDATS